MKKHFLRQGNSPQALVFLHGFLGDAYGWREIMKSLSPPYTTISVDLPGFGLSAPPKAISWPKTEDEAVRNWKNYLLLCQEVLNAVLEECQVDDYVLITYSLSGRLSLWMVLERLITPKALVVESSGAGFEDLAIRQQRVKNDQAIAEKLISQSPRDFLENWYAAPLFDGIKDNPLYGQLLERIEKNSLAQSAKMLPYLSQGLMPSAWPRLGELRLPTLLLLGERDKTYAPIMHRLWKSLPCATLKTVPHASHNTHLMNNVFYRDALRIFLEEILPGTP